MCSPKCNGVSEYSMPLIFVNRQIAHCWGPELHIRLNEYPSPPTAARRAIASSNRRRGNGLFVCFLTFGRSQWFNRLRCDVATRRWDITWTSITLVIRVSAHTGEPLVGFLNGFARS